MAGVRGNPRLRRPAIGDGIVPAPLSPPERAELARLLGTVLAAHSS
jgi:hypothetical protein